MDIKDVINKESNIYTCNAFISDWGHVLSLKYKYENENTGKVKTYKLSKEELNQYLSKKYGTQSTGRHGTD